MSNVAFIGLGVMGYPMAGHLARAGHTVTVYNRTAARAQQWCAEYSGRAAPSPALAAADAEFVLTCVGNDDDVRSVVLGEHGALRAMSAGACLVDHTTASAVLARELQAAAASSAVGFIDAPVSGGEAGAINGQLTIMAGGNQTDFAAAAPVLDAYSKACQLIGPSGSGQLCKMVNQICVAGVLQGLAEALNFGQQAGLDMARVLAVISKGAAQSWQMDNRAATMLEGRYDFGFAVDWMRKDLGIVMAEAERLAAALPCTTRIDEFYAAVQALGGQRWDTSALIEVLRRAPPPPAIPG